MNTMLKNISAIAHKACFTAIALATLAAGTQSSSADVTIEFSKFANDANLTRVIFKFDINGMPPTGQQMNAEYWTDERLPIVASTDNGKDRARSLRMKGNPGESKKVVYLETGGKATKVEIFHKDLDVRGKPDVGTGFSWEVGDGFFAIDQTVVDQKTLEASFYIKKPIAEVIHPDALGKTITNGKVTITSASGQAAAAAPSKNEVLGVTGSGEAPTFEIQKGDLVATVVAVSKSGEKYTQVIVTSQNDSNIVALMKYENGVLKEGKKGKVTWVAPAADKKTIKKGQAFDIVPQPDGKEFTLDSSARGAGFSFSFIME